MFCIFLIVNNVSTRKISWHASLSTDHLILPRHHIDHWTTKVDQPIIFLDLAFCSQKANYVGKKHDGVCCRQSTLPVAFYWVKRDLQIAAANSARARKRVTPKRRPCRLCRLSTFFPYSRFCIYF